MNGHATSPPEPDGFDARSFFENIHWHQRWELFQGVYTPGMNDVRRLCGQTRLPQDLSGCRVLDIGAWHGCFSFECERRGASEVIAYSLEDPEASGFNRIREILRSRVTYVRDSVYTLDPNKLGRFDLILFYGVLYHLRYPLLAIDRIRTVASGDVLVETHVTDKHLSIRSPFRLFSRILPGILRATPVWRQYGEFELSPEDQSNWFGPNSIAVIESFQSAGFQCERLGSWGNRSAFKATVQATVPQRLLCHTYESMDANRELVGLSSIQPH